MSSTVPPISMFRGEYEGNEDPSDWIRRLMMNFPANWTDEQQLEHFEIQCAAGSQAAAWVEMLPGIDGMSWCSFLAAFNLRWPPPVIIPLTAAQKKDRLRAIILKEDNIGVMLDGENGGQTEWGHVRWAKLVTRTALTLGDVNCQLVDTVLDNMPDTLRELIGDTFSSWNEFLTAVANTPHSQLTRLRAHQTADKELQTRIDQLQAQFSGLTMQPATRSNATMNNLAPLSAYRPFPRMSAGNQTHLAQIPYTTSSQNGNLPQPQLSQMPGTDPFMQLGPTGRSNPYYRYRQQPQNPGASRMSHLQNKWARLAATYTNLPHHPDTESGRQAYNKQVSDWLAQHGTSATPDSTKPFPLKPGTAPLASRECFGCGTNVYPNHRSDQCPSPNLPIQEKQWRKAVSSTVGRALRTAMQAPGTLVQYVAPMQHQTYHHFLDDKHYHYEDFDIPPDDSFSGNGNGLQ